MIRFSTVIFGFIFVISVVFCPTLLFAGEKEKYTDLRGRSASKEDYAKALGFSSEPKVLTRGIGPMEPEPKKITAVFDIYFQKGSDIILPKYYTEMQKIGEVLRDHPGEKIQIEGYTCDIGLEDYNKSLSYRRAKNVKSYLIHNYGIDQNRLTVRGYGESRPREGNDTIEGREKNRRVHMLPSPVSEMNEVRAGQEIVIGKDKRHYKVLPPHGRNVIVAITSQQPLFDFSRREFEPAEEYFSALNVALHQVGLMGSVADSIAVAFRFVDTQP